MSRENRMNLVRRVWVSVVGKLEDWRRGERMAHLGLLLQVKRSRRGEDSMRSRQRECTSSGRGVVRVRRKLGRKVEGRG